MLLLLNVCRSEATFTKCSYV
uniref:Uncharacterized protein n=1 Tax=Anguilla anguilla TaxID=7936 RepID=A0A0E9S047_ANGAN